MWDKVFSGSYFLLLKMTTKQIPQGWRREECIWSHEVFLFKAGLAPSWSFSHSRHACALDHVFFFFILVLKTWRLCFCFLVLTFFLFASVCWYTIGLLLIEQALLSCLCSLLKAVVLSRYHGSRLLVDCVSFISLEVFLGGCPIYIWPTKPKLFKKRMNSTLFCSPSPHKVHQQKKSSKWHATCCVVQF